MTCKAPNVQTIFLSAGNGNALRSPFLSVFARRQADQAVSELTTAVNISAGGLVIATRCYFASGVPLSVEVPPAPFPSSTGLPSTNRIFSAESVRVVSVEGYCLIGIRFNAPLASGAEQAD